MANTNTQTLEEELRGLVSEITEVEASKIGVDVNFVNDLGMDSMMALEILAAVEKKYKIKIPEENLTKISTLGNLRELVVSHMS